jgi:hypothetical protein
MKIVKVLVMLVVLCCAGTVMAAYTYSDDFESYALDAPLNGQGGWTVSLPGGSYWENVNNTSTAGSGEYGNGKSAWAVVPPYGNNGITSRTITVDEDFLTVSFLYLPNSNGETSSTPWGSGHFKLLDDGGFVYSDVWYRTDTPMYALNGAADGWIALGMDPGQVAFTFQVEIDFASDQQRISTTITSTSVTTTSGWIDFTGGARTLAEADGGSLEVWGGYRGIDDVSIATIPEPATLCMLGIGGLALLRRKK